MDWYSWLSRTDLELSLRYEYGLVFSRNKLQKDDIIYFNHELLQSLGISIANHRLEILKLVNKELGRTPKGLGIGKLFLVFNKTKKFFTKWVSHKNSNHSKQIPGQLRRINSAKEQNREKSPITRKNVAKSGPIDSGMLEQMMITDKWISLTGHVGMKNHQEKRWMSTNRSPTRHGHNDEKCRETLDFEKCRETLDFGSNKLGNYRPWQGRSPSPLVHNYHADENHSTWSLMFQNMKPT